jgi:hypothetical protein
MNALGMPVYDTILVAEFLKEMNFRSGNGWLPRDWELAGWGSDGYLARWRRTYSTQAVDTNCRLGIIGTDLV